MTGSVHQIEYRPEVDGLRAVAVVPVMFFHAGFSAFAGGFACVDIFFVISGYLISSILMREMSADAFSIKLFYERRARRILPALFVVLLACVPFAMAMMWPDDLKTFGGMLVSVITFSSNIYLWQSIDYFSPLAETQPLLHTWTLGVEEQFYIFFPIMLLLAYRFCRSKIFWLLLSALIVSYLLSEWGWRNKPQANYYLLPTRAWALFAGALVAYWPLAARKSWVNANPAVSEGLAVAGFAMIWIAIFGLDHNTPYPSNVAILPILGTSLIIAFAKPDLGVGRLLASKWIVQIGLISYGTYLWHQPIFAFARLHFIDGMDGWFWFGMIVLSIVFGQLTKMFVEDPFRDRKFLTQKQIFSYSLAGMLLISAIGATLYLSNGMDKRLKQDQQYADSFGLIELPGECADNGACVVSQGNQAAKFAVFGDSHAQLMLSAFTANAAGEQRSMAHMTRYGCPPIQNVYVLRGLIPAEECRDFVEQQFEFAVQQGVDKVFLVSRWSMFTDGSYEGRHGFFLGLSQEDELSDARSREVFRQGLDHTIERYRDAGIDVVFVEQVPLQRVEPKLVYSKRFLREQDVAEEVQKFSVSHEKNESLQRYSRDYLRELAAANDGVYTLSVDEKLCDQQRCIMGTGDISYYYDDDHLSQHGNRHVAPVIDEFLLQYSN